MSFFSKKTPAATPLPGTSQGVTARDVYADMLTGLRQQVLDLRKDKQLWQFVSVIAVLAIVIMVPLQKKVPYFYEIDSSTGRITATNRVAEEVKVSDKNVGYFLRVWTARVVTINAGTLKEGLPSAYKWTRGAASRELDDWTANVDKTTEKIARSPGLTREIIGVPSVSFNEERTLAFIDFVWVEKAQGVERERRHKLLTLEYGMTRPKAGDKEPDDPDNPLGLSILHFTLSDLVAQ